MARFWGDPAEPRGTQPLSPGVCCGTRAWDWETSGEGLSNPEQGKGSLHQKLILSGHPGLPQAVSSEFQLGAVAWQPLLCQVSPKAALSPAPLCRGLRDVAPTSPGRCWSPAESKGAANSSKLHQDFTGATSSTHRQSHRELGNIHGQLRGHECQQDHDTAPAPPEQWLSAFVRSS